MNSLEREILSAFDRPGAQEREFAALSVSSSAREVAAHLVELGWLRQGSASGTFARTEEGRLQLAGPLDLTIYSRPGCHLCEAAKAQVAPLLEEFGGHLAEINIDEDEQLRAQYDYDVPVLVLGSRKIAKHRVDLRQFRRQLHDARSLQD
jgi:glutaredoxin